MTVSCPCALLIPSTQVIGMKIRKLVSPLAFVTFLVVVMSGFATLMAPKAVAQTGNQVRVGFVTNWVHRVNGDSFTNAEVTGQWTPLYNRRHSRGTQHSRDCYRHHPGYSIRNNQELQVRIEMKSC